MMLCWCKERSLRWRWWWWSRRADRAAGALVLGRCVRPAGAGADGRIGRRATAASALPEQAARLEGERHGPRCLCGTVRSLEHCLPSALGRVECDAWAHAAGCTGAQRRTLPTLTRPELEQYDALLRESDPDIFAWATGKVPVRTAACGNKGVYRPHPHPHFWCGEGVSSRRNSSITT